MFGCRLPCRWHESHIIVMEEVVISGPGYDPASTNVPGYSQEQLQSFIDGTNKDPVPEGAQSKANSWHRVTKVVSSFFLLAPMPSRCIVSLTFFLDLLFMFLCVLA